MLGEERFEDAHNYAQKLNFTHTPFLCSMSEILLLRIVLLVVRLHIV